MKTMTFDPNTAENTNVNSSSDWLLVLNRKFCLLDSELKFDLLPVQTEHKCAVTLRLQGALLTF